MSSERVCPMCGSTEVTILNTHGWPPSEWACECDECGVRWLHFKIKTVPDVIRFVDITEETAS